MNLQGSLRVPFLSGPKRTPTVAAATERDGMMRVEEGAWKGLVIILSRDATYRPTGGGCDTTHRRTHHKHTTTPPMCTHPGSSGTPCGPIYPSPGDFAPDGGSFFHPPTLNTEHDTGYAPSFLPRSIIFYPIATPFFINPVARPFFHMTGPAHPHFFFTPPCFFAIASPPRPAHRRAFYFFLIKT